MHQVSEFYDCHPLSAWCPFELSFLAPKLVENLGRYCFFSPWLVLELSWHQCGTTRIHFHLLICNFHNQWDWPNYWANVLGWFVCDSCTRRDMEIKFSFYLLVFKCPTTTTTYDATVFFWNLGESQVSAYWKWKRCVTLWWNVTFLIVTSPLGACFG